MIERHRIADEWKDVILVCTCGRRTAERTKTLARKAWLAHRKLRHADPGSQSETALEIAPRST